MSELEVPDFRYASDFQNWVYELKDKQIQSWTAKDWNTMYDKLNAFIATSPEIEDDVIRMSGKEALSWSKEELMCAKREIFMQSEANAASLMQLNVNYRPEPKQIQEIRSLADDAASKLAKEYQRNGVGDLASLNITTEKLMTTDLYHDVVTTMDGIVYNQTQLGKELAERGENPNILRADIEVSNYLHEKCGSTRNLHGKPVVSLAKQSFFSKQNNQVTAWHELAHAHLQMPKDLEDGKPSIFPTKKLDKDFYQLMQHNGEFYVNMRKVNAISEGRYVYMVDANQLGNGYGKQPMEWFSEYYANRAEHKFREITGQLSEKNADLIANYVAPAISFKNPDEAVYKQGKIDLVYKTTGSDTKKIEQSIQDAFQMATPEFKKKIIISRENDGVHILVPSDYSIQSEIGKLKEIERQRRSSFINTEMATESAKKMDIQSTKESPKVVMKEQAKVAAAKTHVVEKSVTQGGENVATKTATKTTMKTQAVNAAKKAEKSVTNAAKFVGNTALKANTAYDKAVDKVIDKGAEKLNNSAVGKAYNQAATKVAESKVGKVVGKVATQAGQKVAQTAVGKTVGKAVAKTVGTAVGKSVLKKIPVVSVAAGAYFAYDRWKNGDWKGACGELVSGVAGCFPGVGTAASVAIDAGLAGGDIYNAVKNNKEQTAQNKPTNQQQKTTTKTPNTQVAKNKPADQQKKNTSITQKSNQKTSASLNQITQAQQNSRA